MPKRRFADDDPESDDDDADFEEEPVYRGGGKQLPMMGKTLQRPPMEESDDDDESDYEPVSGSGKQFRPSGGKQLRVMDHRESEEDDDEPVQPVARAGGKSLLRPPPQEDSDDDEEDDEPPVQHGGGKSLMGMQQRGGGKQLRPPPPQDDDDDDDSDEDFEEPAPMVVTRAPHGGGKQLRRPAPKSESEDNDEDFDDDAMDIDSSEEEEEEVVEKPAPRRRGRPKSKTAPKKTPARAAKKVVEDMDESSSEEELELDAETFDTKALVESEADQKYLDSLPEFEREAILGERFEKLKAAADMKKALRESKRKEREAQKQKESAKKKPAKSKAKKKKEEVTDGDAELAAQLSSARESTRNRDALGTKAKKDAARAKMREQRKSIIQQKDEEEEEEESDLEFESDEDSDDDYEDSTVKPWQKKKPIKTSARLDRDEEVSASDDEDRATQPEKEVAEAELEDYMKVTLPRRRLARWCNEPYFDQAVDGCFVRLFIGESEDGKKCYRLCEIVGVEKGKTEYKFPASSSKEKPISTSKVLKLRFGKNEKVFPMYLVSDSRPTDEDVKKYVSAQKSSRRDVLGKRQAARIRKQQDELVTNYTYTEADIERNVAERKKTGKALTNLGLEQTRVAIAVQAAQSVLDDAQRRLEDAKRAHLEASENDSEDYEKAIEDAEEAVAEAKRTLEEKQEDEKRVLDIVEKRKKKKLERRQNWARVNERAAKMNQTADFQSYKDQQARKEAESKSGATPRFNPYARRKVKPKILWEVGQKEEKKDDDATKVSDSNETREEVAEGSGANGMEDQEMNDAPQEDIIGSQKASLIGERHQFSIDEEALTPDTAAIFGASRKKQKVSRTRKGLSLAEYQERKSAGTL